MGMTHANSYDEIKPLVELCRAGRLFDVQDWIKSGRPVNPPPRKDWRQKGPLRWAIDLGFHSLVQVLLEGGAEIKDGERYCALQHAVLEKRLDFIQLLVDHGADVNSIDMGDVFDTYQPELMEFFIAHGADVETGNPLAAAFCRRIQPALRIFKQHKDRFPSFQEQVNIALRYHCREGHPKWIALMLWAGADPYSKGPVQPEDDPDPEGDDNALEWAARYEHYEVFAMRQVRLDPKREQAFDLVQTACYGKSTELLTRLMDLGYPLNNQANGGSSLIAQLVNCMTWCWDLSSSRQQRNIDGDSSRERLKMLHLVVKHGARWIPENPREIDDVRKLLLKLAPDYTAELVWIMATHHGCTCSTISELLRTPSIRTHIAAHLRRIDELTSRL